MTEYQKFGHVYLVLSYAVSVIQRDINENQTMTDCIRMCGIPITIFEGLFYDRLQDPLFNVNDLGFYRTSDGQIFSNIQWVALSEDYRNRPRPWLSCGASGRAFCSLLRSIADLIKVGGDLATFRSP